MVNNKGTDLSVMFRWTTIGEMGVKDKYDGIFFLLNLSRFSRFFFATWLTLKRTLSRWSDRYCQYLRIHAGWYVIRIYGQRNGANEMQDSRETAINCLPLDAIRKLYQFDVMLRYGNWCVLWQPFADKLYWFSYDLSTSKMGI